MLSGRSGRSFAAFLVVVGVLSAGLSVQGYAFASAGRAADPEPPAGIEVPDVPPIPSPPPLPDVLPSTGKPARVPVPETLQPTVPEGPSTDDAPRYTDAIARQDVGVVPVIDASDALVDVNEAASAVADGSPVSVAQSDLSLYRSAGNDAATAVPATRVRVIGYSSKAAAEMGVNPVAFSVVDASPDAGRRAASEVAVVRVSINYDSFRYLYGGNWAGRLELVRLPACATTRPSDPECLVQTRVEFDNDVTAGVLTADIPVDPPQVIDGRHGSSFSARRGGSGTNATPYGLGSGFSDDFGSYEATPIANSSSWNAGGNEGSFNYNYSVPVPPTGYGAAPSVAFTYSSMALDGITPDENAQYGLLGAGWELAAGGFIERFYESCQNTGFGTSDLCWGFDNATLNLNGHSSRLVQSTATPVYLHGSTCATCTEWKLVDDPGWKVVKETGGASSAVDDLGETWYVYTPDGTEYTFGQRFENTTGVNLNSVWYEPVFGDDPGEPCYSTTASASYCSQAWRWNLDRIRDRNGNVTSFLYTAEANRYGIFGGTAAADYIRGGQLDEIRYGTHEGDEANYRDRIDFQYKNRCVSTTPADDCIIAGGSATASYFDSPLNVSCGGSPCGTLACSGTSCSKHAPSYWTELALTSIHTAVLEASAWRDLDYVDPKWDLPDWDGTGPQPPQFWLAAIAHAGDYGRPTQVDYPISYFTSTGPLQNRAESPVVVDQRMYRITGIVDDHGRATQIAYGQRTSPASCVFPSPTGWIANTQDCFPKYVPQFGGYGVFWRWYVASTTNYDRWKEVAGVPPADAIVNAYSYGGSPAYGYDDTLFATNRTYSEPRGFSDVLAYTGPDANGTFSLTETLYFQGMGGTIVYPDDATTSVTDDWWLRGKGYDTKTWNVVAPSPILTEEDMVFYSLYTTTSSIAGVANRVDTTRTENHSWTYPTGHTTTAKETVYDQFGFPTQIWDHRDTSNVHDDTCTANFWARTSTPIANWLLDRLSRTVTTEGDPSYPGGLANNCDETQELGITDTYFDSTSQGDSGVTGRPTKMSVRPNRTAAWIDTVETFDAAGNLASKDGPLTGPADTTIYTYDAYEFRATATDPTGHTVASATDPGRGQLRVQTDQNDTLLVAPGYDGTDLVTTLTYDGAGRLTSVERPDPASVDNITYDYTTPTDPTFGFQNGETLVHTSVRQTASVSIDTYEYSDGLGRSVEKQAAGPNGGRLISGVTFDARGLKATEYSNLYDTSAPGTGIVSPNASALPSEVRHTYDSLARETQATTFTMGNAVTVGSSTLQTIHVYQDPWVTTYAPNGNATQDHHNPLGQRDAHVTYNTGGWSGSRTETFLYDPNGNLNGHIDENGNYTAWVYDELGRKTDQYEPNSGVTTYTYHDDGSPDTVTESATSTTLVYRTDVLGRTTQIYDPSTRFTLEDFAYDANGEAGLLDSATSWYYDAFGLGYPIVIDTRGYDADRRPSGYDYVIPAITGITVGTGLAGTYTFRDIAYNDADQQTSIVYDIMGNFPAEQVDTGYNAVGAPVTLTGVADGGGALPLVDSTSFTNRGQLATRNLGTGTYQIQRQYTWDDPTGWLTELKATQNSVDLQDDVLTYDVNGNVTQRNHDRVGTAEDHTECYGYDGINRLTTAFTNNTSGAGSSCTSPSAGGPGAYNYTYSYDDTGNLLTAPAGTYAYPTPGTFVTQPDAAYTIGSTAYQYNGDGTLYRSVTGSTTTTYTWTPQDRLETITDGTNTTTNIYAPGGQRILVHDNTGTKLYLGNLAERDYNTTSGVTTNHRYYTVGTALIAERTRLSTASTSTVSFMLGDNQSSSSLVVTAGTATAQSQWYDPYGRVRGGTTISNTTRGYIGQHQDQTGLDYLNNRYYDPTIGVFLSVDPLVASTGDPYLYAHGNPTTMSDPSGLDPTGSLSSDLLLNFFLGWYAHAVIESAYMQQYDDAQAEVYYRSWDAGSGGKDNVETGYVDIASPIDPDPEFPTLGIGYLQLNEIKPSEYAEQARNEVAIEAGQIGYWSNREAYLVIGGRRSVQQVWRTVFDPRPFALSVQTLFGRLRAWRDDAGVILYEWSDDPREDLNKIEDEDERERATEELKNVAIAAYSRQRKVNREYQDAHPPQYDYCTCS